MGGALGTGGAVEAPSVNEPLPPAETDDAGANDDAPSKATGKRKATDDADQAQEEEEEEEEVEDETRLEDDELSQGPPTKQRLAKVQKSDKPSATTISKRSSKTPSKPKAAPKPKKSVPKPGEAYDINAYF